jgi:hypothetical protein
MNHEYSITLKKTLQIVIHYMISFRINYGNSRKSTQDIKTVLHLKYIKTQEPFFKSQSLIIEYF